MEKDLWAKNTLDRTATLGNNVYYRARRQVTWPDPVVFQKKRSKKFTALDEAFSSIESYLSSTTRSCQKYHRSCVFPTKPEISHCRRFHHERLGVAGNIKQEKEDVHMILPPGSYSVTARNNIDGINQTHVVHVRQGQTVDVDFVL